MASLRIPSLDIFRHRQFTLFWAGRWFGTLAIQMQLAAMFWQVYDTARIHGQDIREGALTLGLVGLAQFLPLLALSLFGGQAADRYTSSYISGVAIGILTIGVMQHKPKALAVTAWSSAVWAEYYARKALVTATSVDNHDFSSFGPIPHSVPELQAEVGL